MSRNHTTVRARRALSLCAWAVLALGLGGLPIGAAQGPSPSALSDLMAETLHNNALLQAATARAQAARARITAAGALDDPMLESGIVNAPLAPFSLRREDMTMQMIGVTQRLPYPGKRALRTQAAEAASNASSLGAQDLRDTLVRDLRLRYEELAALDAERDITQAQLATLESYGSIARLRYGLGTAQQSDALLVETQLAQMRRQVLTLDRRRIELQARIAQLAGRDPVSGWPRVVPQSLGAPPGPLTDLLASSRHRPGIATVKAEIVGAQREIDLARREFYPDFDVRLDYGRRQRTPDGTPRDDMVSLTVSVNLPIWRERRLRPQVNAAQAMLREREAMGLDLERETTSLVVQQHALAHEAREIIKLTDQSLLPTSQAAVNAAVAGYRVGRVEFLVLLETQMRVFEAQLERVAAIADHNRAVAEIDYLTGRWPTELGPQP